MRPVRRSGSIHNGLIVALNNAGYDAGTLIAGLGNGGLGLAMAEELTKAGLDFAFPTQTLYTKQLA